MKNDPEGLGKGRGGWWCHCETGALEGEDEECAEPKVPSWERSPAGKYRVTRTVTGIEAMGVCGMGKGERVW